MKSALIFSKVKDQKSKIKSLLSSQLSTLNFQLSIKKGFTLIELLVVIGILGILAAALVATIDPFEQLKKADDANTKNTLAEYLTANIRYYTTHSGFPWQKASSPTYDACLAVAGGATTFSGPLAGGGAGLPNCTQALIGDNELKSAFATSNALSKIYISYNSAGELVGCFQPQSKSQQNDANTKYNSDGVENATKSCSTVSLTNGCYWCTR